MAPTRYWVMIRAQCVQAVEVRASTISEAVEKALQIRESGPAPATVHSVTVRQAVDDEEPAT